MKSDSYQFFVFTFFYFISNNYCSGSSLNRFNTTAPKVSNSNGKELTIEFIVLDGTFYEHFPRQQSISQNAPVSFSGEKQIFWINNSSAASNNLNQQNPQINQRLRLTCSAGFFTKWKINSDYSGKSEDLGSSHISYKVKRLARDDSESPLESKNDQISNALRNYTEFTIQSFGPGFKSVRIDCVNYLNGTSKSSLYIFQRFDYTNSYFTNIQTEDLHFVSRRNVIPCKFHDPDLSPRLVSRKPEVEGKQLFYADRFSYDWKVGFTPFHNASAYKDKDRFDCVVEPNNTVFASYKFVKGPNKTPTFPASHITGTSQIQIKILPPEKPGNTWNFVCQVVNSTESQEEETEKKATIELKSLKVEYCMSPDYCYSKQDDSSTYRQDVCSTSKFCELVIPYWSITNKESALDIKGKVLCTAEVNGQFITAEKQYFKGISGNIYILSESKQLPREEEIIEINVSNSHPFLLVTCRALKFLTFPPIKMSIKYGDKTEIILKPDSNLQFNDQQFEGLHQVRVNRTSEMKLIHCYAPWYNSTKWMVASYNLSRLDIVDPMESSTFQTTGRVAETTGTETETTEGLRYSEAGLESAGTTDMKTTAHTGNRVDLSSTSAMPTIITEVSLTTMEETTQAQPPTTVIEGGSTSHQSQLFSTTENALNTATTIGEVIITTSPKIETVTTTTPTTAPSTTTVSTTTPITSTPSTPSTTSSTTMSTPCTPSTTTSTTTSTPSTSSTTTSTPSTTTSTTTSTPSTHSTTSSTTTSTKMTSTSTSTTKTSSASSKSPALHPQTPITTTSTKRPPRKPVPSRTPRPPRPTTTRKSTTELRTYLPTEASTGRNDFTVQLTCISVALLLSLMILVCWIRHNFIVEFICCSKMSNNANNKHDAYEMKELKPFRSRIKIPSNYLISSKAITVYEDKLVSEGQFSKLYHGHLKERSGGAELRSVCLKVNKTPGDAAEIRSLLNDIQIKILVGDTHQSIVSILGAHINRKDGKVYVAMRSNTMRNIREYLTTNNVLMGRQKILNMPPRQKSETFMLWLKGILNGLEYLHNINIIHGNLAIENILVCLNNTHSVSLTGFSHSQQLKGDSKYFIKRRSWTSGWETSGWKWMPMETLRYMEFSKETDVWSFGVVMWEIFSMGEIPYAGMGYTNFSMEFVQKLEFGVRLGLPQGTPRNFYNQMESCWGRYGKDRPKFSDLSQYFSEKLNENQSKANTYIYAKQ